MEFVQILGDLLMDWVWQVSGAAMRRPQCVAARRAVAPGGVRDAATMHGPVDDSRMLVRLAGHFRPTPSFFKHGTLRPTEPRMAKNRLVRVFILTISRV